MPDDCVFCRIAAGTIPSTQVLSDDEFYAFRDINPAAPTHILIVPRKHIPRVVEAKADDAALLGRMLLRANEIAEKEGLAEQGFRYVINNGEWGGQTVDHVHVHILGGRPFGWPPG
jgi:histidine triad (HIT) family protein